MVRQEAIDPRGVGRRRQDGHSHLTTKPSPGDTPAVIPLDDLDEQVAARLARQAISDRTGAPQLWCILDEGVLHRAIGGSKVMRSQLFRLAEVAEHPKTTIQVIPFGGAHAGLLAHFVIADLDGKPSVVYLETAAEGQIIDSSSVVAHVALSFDRIRAGAESWVASRDLIRKVAEERWT
jgi:hypothetical protein